VNATAASIDPVAPTVPPASRRRRDRGSRLRWVVGLLVAAGFHAALIGLTRVPLEPRQRVDHLDPRISWSGDRAILEEDTLQGQQLRIFNDAPLFLPTSQNFASTRRQAAEARRPGEIFSSYEPILIVPVDASPASLAVAPVDTLDPIVALRGFRWPYLQRFGRADPVARSFEDRRARIEVRSTATGAVVLAESVPPSTDRETPEVWPDWRPFELHVAVSDARRVSEPAILGGGSGSDIVDQSMRDYVRRRMRLDLRLGPGNYRIIVGP